MKYLLALLILSIGVMAQQPVNTTELVGLFSGIAATGTQTSATVVNPSGSTSGTFIISFASITGSPAGCTLTGKSQDSGVGTTLWSISVTPGNVTSPFAVSSIALQSAATINLTFTCGVYPSTGTMSAYFVPGSQFQLATGTKFPEIDIGSIGGTAPGTAGKLDVKITGNAGANIDAADNATAPTNSVGVGVVDSTGKLQASTGDANGHAYTHSLPDTSFTSYHASKKFAASSTTDNAVLPGNATNTVLLTRVLVTCTQTTAGQVTVELLKRSAADTSGTSASMTVIPDDANYAGGVSVPLSYTGTGPSAGAAVGDLDNAQIGCMAAATATPNDIYIFKPLKPIVLRGVAQEVAVNMGNAALTGGNVTVTFEYIETLTP